MREGWKNVKLGDLGLVITGNTPPRKRPELYGDHTLFIKPTDINIDKKYCYGPEECYSSLGFNKYKKSLIPKGATCVVTIGSIGKKMIKAHTDLFINQAMNAVIPSDQYDHDFVYYLLKSNLFQLKTFDSGTASGRENVSKSSFSNIKVKVPESKITQCKIAAILSAYDDLIENNLKRIKLLEEKAQLTYEEWFVRMKFPGHETAVMDEGTGLPEGWERKSLKSFTKKITKGTTPTSLGKQFSEIGVNFIKAESYTSKGFFIPGKFAHIDEETHQLLGRSQLHENDILVSIAGVLGRVTIVNKNVLPANTNQAVAIVRIDDSMTSPLYIKYFLGSEYMNKLINTITGQAAQPNINLSQLGSFSVLTPTIQTLESFHSLVEPLHNTQLELQNQNQLLKEARDILLPRLMTGMIDVDELNMPESSHESV